jgi:hypothetical protein
MDIVVVWVLGSTAVVIDIITITIIIIHSHYGIQNTGFWLQRLRLFQRSPCGICSGQNCTGVDLSLSTLGLPVNYHFISAPYSSAIRDRYNRPIWGCSTKRLSLTALLTFRTTHTSLYSAPIDQRAEAQLVLRIVMDGSTGYDMTISQPNLKETSLPKLMLNQI